MARIRFQARKWTPLAYLAWWVGLFIGFGPVQMIFFGDAYKGSIFSNSPITYFITSGLFVATFTIAIIYLINRLLFRNKAN